MQQNAALVEEAAAATASLAQQADALQRVVARFQVSEAPESAVAAAFALPA